jgi:gamma-glutamylcyclotransferase (GGCT)/AIG2-like uncharacterized protein YtfP
VTLSALFVYGTLMRGESRHHYLVDRAEFVKEGTVRGTLVHLGEYPGLLLDGEAVVQGELFRLFDSDRLWPVLDEMEGDEYNRVERQVETAEGMVLAQLYALRPEAARLPDGSSAPVIASGSWRSFLSKSDAKSA